MIQAHSRNAPKVDFELDLESVKEELSRFIRYINQKDKLTEEDQVALSAIPIYTVVTDRLIEYLGSGQYKKLLDEHELISSIESYVSSISELRINYEKLH